MKSIYALIVDDDRDDRDILKQEFQDITNTIDFQECATGDEALAYLRSVKANHTALPDIIFLDLHMPGKNGLETLQVIKADDALSNIPVVIITTSLQKEEERKCRAAGCTKYFSKPITVDGYGYIINEAIDLLVTGHPSLV